MGRARVALAAVLAVGAVLGAVTLFMRPAPQSASVAVVLRVDKGRDDALNAQFAGELLIYYARSELSRPGALGPEQVTDFQLAFSRNSTEPFADIVGRSTIINIVSADSDGAVARDTVNAVVSQLSKRLEIWQDGIPDAKRIVLVPLPRAGKDSSGPAGPASYAGGSRPRAALGVLLVSVLVTAAVGTSLLRARPR
ncbi:hypothetical protein Ga0074812_12019 [Parafrankia irregularis]|uniref:Uncharacterized protein n=1 Tax=Parafrankia irregularis TaxID=795642 RepID=A0A0S4QTG6_9ACTN|nr:MULTISPECIES: hypothetical protein [Parafrankia]MBE3205003.1 hypothetical protein [Parafrankia sp. CH37]CUU58521.1 hypothetical protein Ga0074812_12019 [Parafrankia irregularis]